MSAPLGEEERDDDEPDHVASEGLERLGKGQRLGKDLLERERGEEEKDLCQSRTRLGDDQTAGDAQGGECRCIDLTGRCGAEQVMGFVRLRVSATSAVVCRHQKSSPHRAGTDRPSIAVRVIDDRLLTAMVSPRKDQAPTGSGSSTRPVIVLRKMASSCHA